MNYTSSNAVTVYQIDNQWMFNNIDDTSQYPLSNEFGKLLIPFIPTYAHPNGNMVIHVAYSRMPATVYQLTWKGFCDDNTGSVYTIKTDSYVRIIPKLPILPIKCVEEKGDILIPDALIFPNYWILSEDEIKAGIPKPIPGDVFIRICPKEQFPAKAFSI